MVRIVGILNCTPDSFSDRIATLSSAKLIDQGLALIDQGADALDIGGDSTRPGSECPGVEEEWRRIAPALGALAQKIPCSVDTHHAEVARRAIDVGARYINDISGQLHEEMIHTLARSNANYIFMFNAHGGAHRFGEGLLLGTAVSSISRWITHSTKLLQEAGIPSERLIGDPGMGAFISKDPRVSLDLLAHFETLPAPEGGLLLGCSRKGFLKAEGERCVTERDGPTASHGARIAKALRGRTPLYLRVHDVKGQRALLPPYTSS